ncbi:hypothetical protein POVCU2_0010570 [Plasmodium ovale curtisi]|uniref:Uncharacterized protein n=1 Tax=Plasmodium ovale curtisi TaxID=864141 RepID=A0A1A8VTY8_PLAOA|nr:hypothetical protein POVCU2_0010570 [Plasmodium ovale curtisi]SBS84004.1 hypothetical protein POVCU1_009750 [Plasmodium ovale curtisi]
MEDTCKGHGRHMQSVWKGTCKAYGKAHAKRMERHMQSVWKGTCKAYGRHMEDTKKDLSEQGKSSRSAHLENIP